MKLKLLFLLFYFMMLSSASIHLYAQDLPVGDQISNLKKIVILETNHSTQYDLEVKHLTKELVQGFKRQIDTKKYAVLDQSDVVSLLSKMQQIQLCLQDCEVQIGKQLGVSMMISTKFQISQGQHELIIQAYDITTEKLVYIQKVSASNFLDLEKEMLTNLSQFFGEMISNIDRDLEILLENKIEKASGLSFLMGSGIGLDYAFLLGLQLGVQYQTSKFNIRLNSAISPLSMITGSIKFFPNGLQKHHFGLGATLGYFFSAYFYDFSGLYILDIGDFNGFQLNGGLGVLFIDGLYPSANAGITYVF